MKKSCLLAVLLVAISLGAYGMAYQPGLLNSAETITRGNLKLGLYPTFVFGKNGGDSLFGVGTKAGFGLTDRIDVEATGAFFKDFTYLGFDAEYWLYKGEKLNASVSAGYHFTDFDMGGSSSGVDLTAIVSTKPANNMEFYGGLKFSFDSFKGGGNARAIHVVPGMEYKLAKNLDLVGEIGIALNDTSRHYVCIGASYYFAVK